MWKPLSLGSKKFGFPEGENIVCCPVPFIMALALADNAFENGFTSLAQIYKLIVPSSTDRIRLKWNKTWKNRPIFRDVEMTLGEEDQTPERHPVLQDATKDSTNDSLSADVRRNPSSGKDSTRHQPHQSPSGRKNTPGGMRCISKTRSLSYQKHRHYFIRLGRTCGYRKKLQMYDWRRASGKKLNSTLPLLTYPHPQRITLMWPIRWTC